MNNGLGRIVMWVAEILDRNLLTVPDADELDASTPDASEIQAPKFVTHHRKA